MVDTEEKAFEFAADYSKQLITLATAVIAFMVTFSHDVFGDSSFMPKLLVLLAWICFGLSIGLGILKLMALTGNLDPIKKKTDSQKPAPNRTITSDNVRIPAYGQIATFLLGIVFTSMFGCNRIFREKPNGTQGSSKKDTTVVLIQPSKMHIEVDTVFIKERGCACPPHRKRCSSKCSR